MSGKTAVLLLVLLLSASSSRADGWSLGLGTGPFIFGKFAERTQGIRNEESTSVIHTTLSAATRPGASADIELDLSRRLGVRADATWTRAPLRVKTRGGSGTTLEAGDVSITTVAFPLVFHINRGSLQFAVEGGPAAAMYTIHRSASAPSSLPLFNHARTRLGGMGGASLAWWLSRRFAVEGQISDTITSSPFRRENVAPSGGLAGSSGVSIPKTENVHTTIGIRYRFQ